MAGTAAAEQRHGACGGLVRQTRPAFPGSGGWLSTFYGRADLDPVALLPLQGLDGQNGTAPWVAPATTTVCGQDMVAAVFPGAISPAR